MTDKLGDQYRRRFASDNASRRAVWQVLVDARFSRYVDRADTVLDLGCGWGHFINAVDAAKRYALDLNADAADRPADPRRQQGRHRRWWRRIAFPPPRVAAQWRFLPVGA